MSIFRDQLLEAEMPGEGRPVWDRGVGEMPFGKLTEWATHQCEHCVCATGCW